MRKIKLIVLLSMLIMISSACNIVRGSGDVVTVKREVSNFDKVSLSGVGTLYITVGDEESLKIEAEDNVLPYIETRVWGSTLNIGFKDQRLNTAVQPTRQIRYYLTVTDLESLDLSGAGHIEVDNINTSEMQISTSGAGKIEIEKLTAKVLTMEISGTGNCRINEGQVDEQSLQISGAGEYQAQNLQSQIADIEISGLGSARVWVEESLMVEISGTGSVNYYGRPSISQDVSGAGTIQSLGVKQ